MTLKLFYICGAVGLIIGGFLLHIEQHIPMRLIISSLGVAALIMFFIARWQKRRGMLK
jgi:uncharacterized membrane protein YfcA